MNEQINQSIDQSANVDILQLQKIQETRSVSPFEAEQDPPFETEHGLCLSCPQPTFCLWKTLVKE